MRKTASFLILIVFTLAFSMGMFAFSTPNIAYAESNKYILIPDKTATVDLTYASVSVVPFRSEVFEEQFYLPTTYYVKEINFNKSGFFGGEGGGFYEVQYNGLQGMIIIPDLRNIYDTLPTPSTNATVDTVGEAPQAFNAQNVPYLRYKSEHPSIVDGAKLEVDESWTFSYMGEAVDTTKYFVKCVKEGSDTVYGTIAKDSFESFSIPLHQVVINAQNELKEKDKEPDGAGGTLQPQNDTLIKTILIIGIIIPAVLIVILLFKPRKRGNNYDYHSRRMTEPSKYDYGRDRRYDDDRYQDDYKRYDNRQSRPRDDYYQPRDFRDEDR